MSHSFHHLRTQWQWTVSFTTKLVASGFKKCASICYKCQTTVNWVAHFGPSTNIISPALRYSDKLFDSNFSNSVRTVRINPSFTLCTYSWESTIPIYVSYNRLTSKSWTVTGMYCRSVQWCEPQQKVQFNLLAAQTCDVGIINLCNILCAVNTQHTSNKIQ